MGARHVSIGHFRFPPTCEGPHHRAGEREVELAADLASGPLLVHQGPLEIRALLCVCVCLVCVVYVEIQQGGVSGTTRSRGRDDGRVDRRHPFITPPPFTPPPHRPIFLHHRTPTHPAGHFFSCGPSLWDPGDHVSTHTGSSPHPRVPASPGRGRAPPPPAGSRAGWWWWAGRSSCPVASASSSTPPGPWGPARPRPRRGSCWGYFLGVYVVCIHARIVLSVFVDMPSGSQTWVGTTTLQSPASYPMPAA